MHFLLFKFKKKIRKLHGQYNLEIMFSADLTTKPKQIINVKQLKAKEKRKCQFTSELKKKFLCFRNGRNVHEALCSVCPPATYVSVVNSGLYFSIFFNFLFFYYLWYSRRGRML